MGLIFKCYSIKEHCPKCNIKFSVKTPFIFDQSIGVASGKCPECDTLLEPLDYLDGFYVLRFTKLRIPHRSGLAWALVIGPSIVFGATGLLFFFLFCIATLGYIGDALNLAAFEVYVLPFRTWLGSDWPGIIVVFLSAYFVYRLAGGLLVTWSNSRRKPVP